jgi:hypothetical protein
MMNCIWCAIGSEIAQKLCITGLTPIRSSNGFLWDSVVIC